MGLSLGDLYTSSLLFLNAIAVLHEERFLAKRAAVRPGPPASLSLTLWPVRVCGYMALADVCAQLSPLRRQRQQAGRGRAPGWAPGTRAVITAWRARPTHPPLDVPRFADGWSTNSPEVTLNPSSLKSKVLH